MINKATLKEIRGWVLRMLYNNLPEFTGDKLIYEILMEGGFSITLPLVQGHLRYLEEKGYLELQTASVPELGMTRLLAKLTSKGVDLVEGTIPEDPGVERK